MNETKKEKIQDLKNRIENSINDYPEAWTAIGVSVGLFLLRGLKKRRNKKKGMLLVSLTSNEIMFTNLTGKTIKYDILSNTENLKTYAIHIA